MTATRRDIEVWIEMAKNIKGAFLIIGHDPFDNDNFPIYCENAQECRNRIKSLAETGNRYDEVYDMSMSIEAQLAENRAIHIPLDNAQERDIL